MSHEPMHRIIRLKRYEQPPEGYFDDFLREFHQRQRAELLKPSLTSLFLERLSVFFSEFRVPAMAYAGAAAVAVFATATIMRQPRQVGAPRAYAAAYQQAPVTISGMQPVSLRVDPQGQGPRPQSPLLPPSFLLQARPASHESPISF